MSGLLAWMRPPIFVATAFAEGRALTAVEDSHVLQLMKQAQNLNEAIARLRKHHVEQAKTCGTQSS